MAQGLARSEPKGPITLYQGVLKKGTKLGISAFVPLLCRRNVPKQSPSWSDGKYPRWRHILTEAAEQAPCGRILRAESAGLAAAAAVLYEAGELEG